MPGTTELTPKQRMLNAYRGIANDRPAVAPEFWVYYPAKLQGADMLDFWKTPFHLSLKQTFESFGCEGWGCTGVHLPNPAIESTSIQERPNPDTIITRTTHRTSKGIVTTASHADRHEPGWVIERAVKDPERDWPVQELIAFPDLAAMDCSGLNKALQDVGESMLLEVHIGNPFFDFYAGAREGGLEAALFDFMDRETWMAELQEKYIDYMIRKVGAICEASPVESLFVGCSWSCNSLIGPDMWRRWDKPLLRAVTEEAHRHGRLLHAHVHGKCIETVADFAEIGIDCVCPFERGPGGDVNGLAGLKEVARLLDGRTTMNGNVHTVETLIRGRPEDVRREVSEILEAFAGNPRVIVGTGDQVGRETPEENIHAMLEAARGDSQLKTEKAIVVTE